MEALETKNKLVLAIVQEDDYDITVEKLNENRLFVTKLSSSGGFLKKKNVTILIGVEEERVELVLDILKKYAGRRKQTVYTVPAPMGGAYCVGAEMAVPVDQQVGGATVFTLNLDSLQKF